jgi:hypothetical protein
MLILQKLDHSDQGSPNSTPPEHIELHKDARASGDFGGDKSLPADVRGSGTLDRKLTSGPLSAPLRSWPLPAHQADSETNLEASYPATLN